MSDLKSKIEAFKAAGLDAYDGKLYKSITDCDYSCGSAIYDSNIVTSIDVAAIKTGFILLDVHFPSKGSGRWETSSVFCKSVDNAIEFISRTLGKPSWDIESNGGL